MIKYNFFVCIKPGRAEFNCATILDIDGSGVELVPKMYDKLNHLGYPDSCIRVEVSEVYENGTYQKVS